MLLMKTFSNVSLPIDNLREFTNFIKFYILILYNTREYIIMRGIMCGFK
eukprot:UN00928